MATIKKINIIYGWNPQKAHLGIMVDICTKFGEGSMYTLGDMLRTKCVPRWHNQSQSKSVSMATTKNIIKILSECNPQKAHLEIMVDTCTKFGEASMYS